MLARGPCTITPLTTSGDLYSELARIGPPLLLEVLAELPDKLSHAEPQDDALATHAAKITKAEAQLDWSLPAPVLARRIRAFNPAPGCFTLLGDQRLKVWTATPSPGAASGAPGSVLAADQRGVLVSCGEGALLLDQIQLPGGKAMQAAQILRGKAALFSPGTRFTSAASP
jgi:methionyl-tRNA formyltransferase